MSLLTAIVECLTGQSDSDNAPVTFNEKGPAEYTDEPRRTTQEIAASVLDTLFTTEKNGRDLERTLNNIVSTDGWTESLAEAILSGLENALKAGAPMGQAMKEAFERAMKEAVDFAHDHPVFCTVIALGILVLLVPWAIEALGFAELGPVEGEFGWLCERSVLWVGEGDVGMT